VSWRRLLLDVREVRLAKKQAVLESLGNGGRRWDFDGVEFQGYRCTRGVVVM
jgi:hypothetical protein